MLDKLQVWLAKYQSPMVNGDHRKRYHQWVGDDWWRQFHFSTPPGYIITDIGIGRTTCLFIDGKAVYSGAGIDNSFGIDGYSRQWYTLCFDIAPGRGDVIRLYYQIEPK
jgi:hypothetical protein